MEQLKQNFIRLYVLENMAFDETIKLIIEPMSLIEYIEIIKGFTSDTSKPQEVITTIINSLFKINEINEFKEIYNKSLIQYKERQAITKPITKPIKQQVKKVYIDNDFI